MNNDKKIISQKMMEMFKKVDELGKIYGSDARSPEAFRIAKRERDRLNRKKTFMYNRM